MKKNLIVILFFMILSAEVYSKEPVNITGKLVGSSEVGIDGYSPYSIGEIFIDTQTKSRTIDNYETVWKLVSKKSKSAGKTALLLCIYENDEGACLVAFEKRFGSFLCIGAYSYIFGGNGAAMEIKSLDVKGKSLFIDLECTGYLRGYYDDEEHTKWLEPSENIYEDSLEIDF